MQRTPTFGQIARFFVVGGSATLLYAVLATLFVEWSRIGLAPVPASVLAYLIAAGFSYAGHKFATFMSAGAHRTEAPRFILLTLAGLVVSWLLPMVLTDKIGLAHFVAVAATCIIIPVINFVVLDRWVFRREVDGSAPTQESLLTPRDIS